MQLRFLDQERTILTLDALRDLDIPRRGEEVILKDPLTDAVMVWGVVQVQRWYVMQEGSLHLSEVRAQVRAIEPAHFAPSPLEL
jgi:hypothetical protein